VPIKSWSCPGCHRSFIVDAEATKDTCPWCQATVEEKGGALHLLSESPKGSETPKASEPPHPEPQPANAAASSGAGAANAPGGQATGQTWWPFEYSS
jgi:hypothetical protein